MREKGGEEKKRKGKKERGRGVDFRRV